MFVRGTRSVWLSSYAGGFLGSWSSYRGVAAFLMATLYVSVIVMFLNQTRLCCIGSCFMSLFFYTLFYSVTNIQILLLTFSLIYLACHNAIYTPFTWIYTHYTSFEEERVYIKVHKRKTTHQFFLLFSVPYLNMKENRKHFVGLTIILFLDFEKKT